MLTNPFAFELALGDSLRKTTRLHLAINNDPAVNRMFIASESIEMPVADSIKKLRHCSAIYQATLTGWMLSTGTLRLLALLAFLRHPKPPPLIVGGGNRKLLINMEKLPGFRGNQH